jgi:hypothetical protein
MVFRLENSGFITAQEDKNADYTSIPQRNKIILMYTLVSQATVKN